MELIKINKLNYDEVRNKLNESEDARVNMVLMLMELKPYRRSIFNQIHDSKHIIHKEWNKMSYEDKLVWIKKEMFKKWSPIEFVEHLINAIKTFRLNGAMSESFKTILDTY